jgi:hypothetical protein
MKEITENADGLKIHVGHDAVIQADGDGLVLSQRAASTRPVMTISGRKDVTLKVGTDAEVDVEAQACAVKYAPIKAAADAAKAAAAK